MDAKKILTNGVFCPMPWVGLMYNHDGTVKNCIRSAGPIGNIQKHAIEDILLGDINQDTQAKMSRDQPGTLCHPCYDLENRKKSFDIISDRIFYIREMKRLPLDTYSQGQHSLRTVDLRWSNLCNFACVYCSPNYSSRWAQEMKMHAPEPNEQQKTQFKSYVFDRIKDLKHVYLAGGEPLLMKENLEMLDLLKRENSQVNLRINTNLSKVDNKIFDRVCGFQNVQWIVSVESMEDQFEYIRYGGRWADFIENLEIIKELPHKISFNMLYFLLNHQSFFDTVDYLRSIGFHPNSFVAGALLWPDYLNIRHLPDHVLKSVLEILQNRINQSPGYLLEDSYRNLMHYIQQPFTKDLAGSLAALKQMDQRRNLNSEQIFPHLYQI